MTDGAEDFYIFKSGSGRKKVSSVGFLSSITIDGMTINPDGNKPVRKMILSNVEIETKSPVDFQMKNVVVNNPLTRSLVGSSRPSVQLKVNLPLKGGRAQLSNAAGIVQ